MKITDKKAMKYVIIVALLLIPFMYSFFYLKAFWDPYGKMNEIPVAVVNLDKGTNNKGKELIDSLQKKNVLKFSVTDKEKAEDGLQDQTYYAVITIPSDFTSRLESAKDKNRKYTTITYSPNQKSNYLASQIISRVITEVEKETNANVAKEVVNTLSDKLKEVPEKVTQIESGLAEIENGTSSLKEGTGKLTEGMQTLQNGATTLTQNYETFDAGLLQSKNGVDTLVSGTQSLHEGATNLNAGVTTYVSSVDKLAGNITNLSTLLTLLNEHPEYINLPQVQAQLKAATQTLNALTTKQNGVSEVDKLVGAGKQIKQGANQLENGSKTLYQGSTSLQTGMQTLKGASTTIQNGMHSLQAGIVTASNGVTQLDNGTSTLHNGVSTAKTEVTNQKQKMEEEISALDGLGDYVKKPVQIKENDTPKVNEYGTAFAPYFISISLWVGALMLFVVLYYDVNDRFPTFSRNAKNKTKRTFAYMGIATLQALVLGIILKVGLGYTVTNYGLYFAALVLAANAFVLIIEFLIVHFNDVGKFLAILLLVLQLAASAGTFPIETVPTIFQKIYPFMPIGYTVRLFKEALIRIDAALLTKDVCIMIGILVFFFCVNFIKDKREQKKQLVK
ncbi:MAG: YhgE/Pip domain-containing protein [Bacilli bacterium]|nr:YhgE/Pip domain-containing protein [Bacilli bacterium]